MSNEPYSGPLDVLVDVFGSITGKVVLFACVVLGGTALPFVIREGWSGPDLGLAIGAAFMLSLVQIWGVPLLMIIAISFIVILSDRAPSGIWFLLSLVSALSLHSAVIGPDGLGWLAAGVVCLVAFGYHLLGSPSDSQA